MLFLQLFYRKIALRLPEFIVEEEYWEAVITAIGCTCSVFIRGVKDEVAPVTITVPLKAKAEEWV